MSDTSKYGSRLEEHPNWKGGRTVTSHGYVLIKAPNHPDSDSRGYIYEHRLVAEQMLGRRLDSDEHVHHKNEDKQDNRPENLEVLHETEHLSTRHFDSGGRKPGEPNPFIKCACGCGDVLRKYDDGGRPRERVNGHSENTASKRETLETLRREGPLHRAEMAERAGVSVKIVSGWLTRFRKAGQAEPAGEGYWTATETGGSTDG